MPTDKELNDMCKALGINYAYCDIGINLKAQVMQLTIALKQASALYELSYNYAFASQKG